MRLAALLDLALRMVDDDGRDRGPGPLRRLLYHSAGCLSLLVAALLLLLALFLALLPELGAVRALLVVAVIPAIIGVVFAVRARQSMHRVEKQMPRRTHEPGGELEALLKAHKGASLLALFAAAFERGAASRKK